MLITGQGTATSTCTDFNTDSGPSSGGPTSVLIENTDSTNTLYICGTSSGTASTGKRLLPGAVYSADFVGPNDVFVVTASGKTATYDFIYERNS